MTEEKKFYFIGARAKTLLKLGIFSMGLILGLRYLFPLLTPFLLGAFFAWLIDPMVRKLEFSLKIRRKLVISLLLILLVLFILGFIYMVTIALIREAQRFLPRFPVFFNEFPLLIEKLNEYCRLRFPQLEEFLPYFSLNLETFSHVLRSIIEWAAQILALFPKILFTIGLSGVTAYFFSRDKQVLTQMLYQNVPKHWLEPLIQVKNEIVLTIARFIKAELILVSITAFLTFFIFSILSLPGALIYSLLAGVLDFAPGVGPGLIYIPIIVILFLNNNYYQASALLTGYFFIIFLRQMAEFKIMGENLNFHPLLTMLVIYFGIKIFGFSGIFFGPVLVIVFRAFYKASKAKQFSIN